MISKLFASAKKETFLLVRDPMGLSILIVMPMVLIFVMTLIQDAAFKTMNEKGIPIIFVNGDKDSLGILIEQGLKSNEPCAFYDSLMVNRQRLKVSYRPWQKRNLWWVLSFRRVPQPLSGKMEPGLVNEAMEPGNEAGKPSLTKADSEIQILIDPIAKKSFLSSITSSLKEFISEVKT